MASSSIVNGEELGEPERRPLNPSAKGFIISLGKHSAISQGTKDIEKSNTDTMNKFITHCSGNGAEDGRTSSGNVISGYEGDCGTTFGVIDNKADTTGEIVDVTGCELSSGDKESLAAGVPQLIVYPIEDGVPPMEILPNSSHCDGSIYRGTDCWKKEYHIADRNEIPADHGLVELYGYIAVRDRLDTFLNYFVNFSRDDPIVVEQGSLIHMAGPKRGNQLIGTNLIEYDMKIKTVMGAQMDLKFKVATDSCIPAEHLLFRRGDRD
uniref:DUF6598 domain-containing protein n=1 Tax=Oryza glumipatula TaxID=40148 RepID=A0A0E0AUR4_9ORYZ